MHSIVSSCLLILPMIKSSDNLFIAPIMRKLTTSLLRTGFLKQKHQLSFLQPIKSNQMYFATMKSDKDPNQVPQQVKKMMQSQKAKKKPQQILILKDISQAKSIDQLPDIFKKMVFMPKEHRQIAVRYLLSAIYQQKLPVQTIKFKPLEVTLSEYPQLKLQTEIYQMNHLVHQIKEIKSQLENVNDSQSETDLKQRKLLELYNKINDMYFHSFNTTLKSIPEEQAMRSKATLYKHFAEYNFEHLFDPKISDPNSSLFDQNLGTLKKARQFLMESLKCHKQVLLNEHKKLQSDQIKSLREEDAQRHQIRLNAIKENIRKLVESIGECLYAIFKVINKEHRLLKDPVEHKNRKIELLSLIDTYIPFYSIIPGIKELSMMYYKLYKIKIEARFTSVNEPKNQDEVKAKIKQTVEDYNRLYLECLDCLDESVKIDKFYSIKEISTTIISIKYMIGRTVKKSQLDIKKSLAQEAKCIIDKMKKEFKQPMQLYLLQIIKEMLNLKA